MKTILAPTDYSDVANNTLQYAAELAKYSKAKLILMHVYQIPIPSGEVPVMMITPQEFEKENKRRIKHLENKISAETKGNLKIESIVRAGFPVDEISDVIKETDADLVIMGITGEKISEVLIGSHTTALIKRTRTPVLVIPKGARFGKIKKIALASDYNDAVNRDAVQKVKSFAKFFKAQVLVLDVERPEEIPIFENTVGGEKLEKLLHDVEHSLFYSSADDITDGLNSFAADHQCDWIAMIPHKHTVLGKLFHKSNTKKMAFHTHVPLLSIHE